MVEFVNRLVKRAQKPAVAAMATIGGGFLMMNFLKSKLNDMQLSLTRNRISTENLRRRFEQNQEDCTFTVSALIPTLGKQILDSLNVERLADVLSQTKSQNRVLSDPETNSKNKGPSPPLSSENTGTAVEDLQQTNGYINDSVGSLSEMPSLVVKDSDRDQPNGIVPALPSRSSTPKNRDIPEALIRPDGSKLQKRSEIWKEMMLVSFSRLFTCLYGLTLLTLQTHIQLGLLGREAYLNSIVSFENTLEVEADDFESQILLEDREVLDVATERRYLTFSWWYLHKGWKILSERVRSAVEEVLTPKSLKDKVTLSDLEILFEEIRTKLELEVDGSYYSFSKILLPSEPTDEIETLRLGGMSPEDCLVNPRLRGLLDETQDLLDCPDFQQVLKSSMDRIFEQCQLNIGQSASLLNDGGLKRSKINELVNPRFRELSDEELKGANNTAIRLVEILPIVSKESLMIVNTIPNSYIETLRETIELREFSTVIYTAFDNLIDSYRVLENNAS
ncbi:Peroxin-3 [Phakopsora pachyrhizi]|uniref:Peroxin-3 n=1 Tax=Phakopsora pachyrhizi TaxID=170000 RepID=A0AAV0BK80_PHAPC|nr:Peroxin-3 [Phakopsora pachyrhizi]CAH7685923.1 Peroxin-3 [Phakopsora pachyrhizi]